MDQQQLIEHNRADRKRRLHGNVDKQVLQAHGAAQGQESVRRVRQKAGSDAPLPALPQPATKTKAKTRKKAAKASAPSA